MLASDARSHYYGARPSLSQVFPFVLLNLGVAAREKFVASPADLLYGESLQLPGDAVLDVSERLDFRTSYEKPNRPSHLVSLHSRPGD